MSFRFRRRGDVNDQSPQQEPFFQNASCQQQLLSDNPGYPQMGPQQGYDPTLGNQNVGNYNTHPYFQQQEPGMQPSMQAGNYPNQPYFAPTEENFYPSQQMQQGMAFRHPQQPPMNAPTNNPYGMQNPQAPQYGPYMHPVQASQLSNLDQGYQAPQGYGQEDVRSLGFWRENQANTGFEEPESEQEEGSPVRLLVAVAGVALIAGLSWFAYKWAKSPTYDTPPLIHAEAGPHKVRPDHRGGINIPYQDKLIYDRITDGDTNSAPPERLLPPPEAPSMETQQQPPMDPNQQQMAPQQMAGQPMYNAPGAGGMQAPVMQNAPGAPVMQHPQQMQPMPPQQMAGQQQGIPIQQVPVNPQMQQQTVPAGTSVPAVAPVVAQTSETVQDTVKPDVTKGGYYVQMVTVKSEAAALSEWKRRQKKYNLKDMKSQIKEFETEDGQVFYRLLMGPFPDKVKAMKYAVKMDGSKVVHIAE